MEKIINENLLREDIAEGIATVLGTGDMNAFLPYVTDDEVEIVLQAMFNAESVEIHRIANCIQTKKEPDFIRDTGLKDKNKEKIYLGDILKISDDDSYIKKERVNDSK